jgi:hypothetical protein
MDHRLADTLLDTSHHRGPRSAGSGPAVSAAVALALALGGCAAPDRGGDTGGTLGERVTTGSTGGADAGSAATPATSPPASGSPVPAVSDPVDAATTRTDGANAAATPGRAPATPAPGRTTLPDAATLQAGVIALGDEIIDLVVVGTDAIEDGTDDVARRQRAHEIKLAVARSVVNTVAGPSSFAALVDLVTKSTLLVRAAEIAGPARFGEQASLLIEPLTRARDQAWRAASRLMTEQQVNELRAAVEDLPLEVNDLVFVAQISVREAVASFDPGTNEQRRRQRVSLLSLLAIDPLANLDPTNREIQQSRLLGERGLYQAQRTGRILRWEVEGLLYDLLAAPETQNMLRAADRASRASDSIGSTLSLLPATLEDERTAALAEIDAIVSRQRTALLAETEAAVARQREAAVDDLQRAAAAEREALRADVAAVEGPLVRTMDSARATAAELTQMSESLDRTIVTFDALMARFGVDATAESPADQPAAERTPFDVSVYGAVATDVGSMARDLTQTFTAFEAVLDQPVLRPGTDPDAAPAPVPAAVALQETGTALLNGLLVRGIVLIVLAGLTTIAVALFLRRRGPGG